MVLIAATKILVFILLEVKIFFRLLRALHANAFPSLISLSVLFILNPRYMKSLTRFRGLALLAMSGPWLFTLNAIYSVFLAFRCRHVLQHLPSTLESSSWAGDKSSKRIAMPSAKLRSDIFSVLLLLDLLGLTLKPSYWWLSVAFLRAWSRTIMKNNVQECKQWINWTTIQSTSQSINHYMSNMSNIVLSQILRNTADDFTWRARNLLGPIRVLLLMNNTTRDTSRYCFRWATLYSTTLMEAVGIILNRYNS